MGGFDGAAARERPRGESNLDCRPSPASIRLARGLHFSQLPFHLRAAASGAAESGSIDVVQSKHSSWPAGNWRRQRGQ
jgi:hypothetical protein